MTCARTPSITLVRSVTVKTTRCGSGWPLMSDLPSVVTCSPGVIGKNLLSTLGLAGKLAGTKSVRRSHGGALVDGCAAGACALHATKRTPTAPSREDPTRL